MKKHNFSAGPSILPQEVLEQAAEAVKNFNGMGLSLIEISHRSPEFGAVIDKARELVYELSGLNPDEYEVLFQHGGASTQFIATAWNLLRQNGKAGFIDTGTWSSKAIKETRLFGEVDVIASSKENGYKNIPVNYHIPGDLDYLHITSNNTIYGTQYSQYPELNIPLVADMSSDIFSKDLDFSRFDLIYAGAQKNVGASGTTLVILKKSLIGQSGREIPSMLNYRVQAEKGSMFNTPSVFSIYVSMLYLQWLKDLGGIKAIEKRNREKAALLYEELDNNSNFIPYADKDSRSIMNVTFNLSDPGLKERFDKLTAEAGIHAIKGHRSVGGYRASIYNALPLDSVKVLVQVMKAL
jgi:phosphoserine aminotransferase